MNAPEHTPTSPNSRSGRRGRLGIAAVMALTLLQSGVIAKETAEGHRTTGERAQEVAVGLALHIDSLRAGIVDGSITIPGVDAQGSVGTDTKGGHGFGIVAKAPVGANVRTFRGGTYGEYEADFLFQGEGTDASSLKHVGIHVSTEAEADIMKFAPISDIEMNLDPEEGWVVYASDGKSEVSGSAAPGFTGNPALTEDELMRVVTFGALLLDDLEQGRPVASRHWS